MWSSKLNNILTAMQKAFLPLLLLIALAGCFRPLYAQIDPNNITEGSSVYVETIDGEIGQILQTELQFLLKSVRDKQGRSLRLNVRPAQSGSRYFVDVDRDRDRLGAVIMQARYTLREEGGGAEITKGIARSSATYEAGTQINNSASAKKDAASRAAKLAARIIADKIAFALNLDEKDTLSENSSADVN